MKEPRQREERRGEGRRERRDERGRERRGEKMRDERETGTQTWPRGPESDIREILRATPTEKKITGGHRGETINSPLQRLGLPQAHNALGQITRCTTTTTIIINNSLQAHSQCRHSQNANYALCVGHQVLRGHQKIGN